MGWGAVLVGGHTEVTGAVRQPLVVGQMLGVATERTVPTGGLRPGDAVVQIGPAPVEGAAVLAGALPPERLAMVSARTLEAARSALDTPGISVVEPALSAARAGASALHDPTEGGLAAGLHEMAEASGVALVVQSDRILWFEPGVELCAVAGLDPWGTLASGTLLAGFASDRCDGAVHELARAGHSVSVIGRATPGCGVTCTGGAPLIRFERDEMSRLLERNAGQPLVSVLPVMAETEDVAFVNGIDHLAGVFEERPPVIISMLAEPAEGEQVDAFFITEFPEQTRETPPGGGVDIEPGVFGRFDNQASGLAVAGGSHPLPSRGQAIMGLDQLGNRLLSDDRRRRHRHRFVRKAIRADVPENDTQRGAGHLVHEIPIGGGQLRLRPLGTGKVETVVYGMLDLHGNLHRTLDQVGDRMQCDDVAQA